MKGIPQGRYTKEFRLEAVKLVTDEGLSLGEAAWRNGQPFDNLDATLEMIRYVLENQR